MNLFRKPFAMRCPAFFRPTALAGLASLLAACTTMAPHYERPAASVAAAFPAAAPASGPATDLAPAAQPWQA